MPPRPRDPLGRQSLSQPVGKPLKRVGAKGDVCMLALQRVSLRNCLNTCLWASAKNAPDLGSAGLAADKIAAECLFAAHPFKTPGPASLLFRRRRRESRVTVWQPTPS